LFEAQTRRAKVVTAVRRGEAQFGRENLSAVVGMRGRGGECAWMKGVGMVWCVYMCE
jgi:hypothetical protein